MRASDYMDESDGEFDYEAEQKKKLEREKKQREQKEKSNQRTREQSMPVERECNLGESVIQHNAFEPQKLSTSASQVHLLSLVSEYEERQIFSKDTNEISSDLINCVTVGNVDSGKSTIFGHLCYLLENSSKKVSNYAHYLDTSPEEQERNITISVNSYNLEMGDKTFLMQDAPGHEDFSDELFINVIKPDCGILVIEAENFDRTEDEIKEHLTYLMVFAVPQILVLVNKMDLLNFDREIYNQICAKVQQMIDTLIINKGINVEFVPCAGKLENSNNLIEYCPEMSFATETVRQAIYTLRKDKTKLKSKFPAILLLDVTEDNSKILARIYVDNGILMHNDVIYSRKTGLQYTVVNIQSSETILRPGTIVSAVLAPYLKNVEGLRIADSPKTAYELLKKGDSFELVGAFIEKEIQVLISDKIRVQLLITSSKGLCIGDEVECFIGIERVEGYVRKIDAVLKKDQFLTTNQGFLKEGEFALIVLKCKENVCCQKVRDSRVFGRVVIRQNQEVLGFGFIMGIRKASFSSK